MFKLSFIKFSRLCAICFIAITIIGCNGESKQHNFTDLNENNLSREQVIEIAIEKYYKFAKERSPIDGYPRSVENEHWVLTNWKSWTDGFFPGILWQLSIVDPSILEQAKTWTLPLESHTTMPSHDLGFIINNSFGKAYRLTGDIDYLPMLEKATNNLSSRFNMNVGATRSWDFGSYSFPVIVDNMMNLALLFDSSKVLNSEPYYSQAVAHAYTTLDNHVRNDGTSFHLVDFSPLSGEVINKVTVQGLADDSTWARGQAWGLYGFTLAFIESGEIEFLVAAEKLANYFIDNLPEDSIPYWDFYVNDLSEPRDSSAGAIAASGLWMLSKQTNDPILEDKFRKASLTIVDSLISEDYFNQDDKYPALLMHATGNKPGDKEVDTSLIYADYYLIEALLMQLGYMELPV
ncbi:glucuronyl hydrolase [Thalassotalea sp. M1531]|uniref:Glucuronyl hydrolase n=1 Tax=Thalassotalea algicola TaxID=2716224 RepID=A0A7Y0LGU0_9GAMM|nr:glycoside hydrolase family 88 protein [Thalassotalea algicola]NMP32965.1 glucuronyl hydrolase [Thalassotalea algicola]